MTPPILFHGEIRHQTTHIEKLGSTQCPYHQHHLGHFLSPLLLLPTKTLAPPCHRQHPCKRNSDGGVPNSAAASNGAYQRSKSTDVNPPKSAFPAAAVVIELTDDVK